jgi:hypothetical protein
MESMGEKRPTHVINSASSYPPDDRDVPLYHNNIALPQPPIPWMAAESFEPCRRDNESRFAPHTQDFGFRKAVSDFQELGLADSATAHHRLENSSIFHVIGG